MRNPIPESLVEPAGEMELKRVKSLAIGTQRSVLFAYVVFGIIVITLFGCGEADDPLKATEENPVTIGSLKRTEAVPAAPAAPQSGFHIKEVGYYTDWKLTKPLSGNVTPGATIFLKVVFSEPIQFKPADDASARPILYYRINTDRFRYRVAKHGAGGEDFVSGDAKPLHSGTDDYICKFTVPQDATGRFRVEVGKLNANKDGTTLPAFYTHKEVLQIAAEVSAPKETPVTPAVQETVADEVAPVVLSIEHSLDESGRLEIDENEYIDAGADVFTIVRFSEPVTPVVTYATGRNEKRFTLAQRGGIHWRGTCKPMDVENTTFVCKQTAREDSYHVTVLADTADFNGNRLGEAVPSSILSVEPRVVIVSIPQEIPVQPVTPVPEETKPTSDKMDDVPDYTSTLEGIPYPGYNPPPALQHILDTHPSANLPFFEEAVKKTEVIGWVFLMAWSVYPDWESNPDSFDKIGAAHNRVLTQFGMNSGILGILTGMYFNLPPNYEGKDAPPHSQYWLVVEYLRLQMQHPGAGVDLLLVHFERSKHNVVGLTNPHESE